jgi:hypothetical protein
VRDIDSLVQAIDETLRERGTDVVVRKDFG